MGVVQYALNLNLKVHNLLLNIFPEQVISELSGKNVDEVIAQGELFCVNGVNVVSTLQLEC